MKELRVKLIHAVFKDVIIIFKKTLHIYYKDQGIHNVLENNQLLL
jgi:hypothetical protein